FHLGDAAAARSLYEESLTLQQELGNRLGVAAALESLATLAQHEASSDRAVRLWGATSALREAIGSMLAPHRQEELESEMAAVRKSMGDAAFAAAWEAGRAMAMEQAIHYALKRSGTSPPD